MAPIQKTIKSPAPKVPAATQPSPIKRPGRIVPALGAKPPSGP